MATPAAPTAGVRSSRLRARGSSEDFPSSASGAGSSDGGPATARPRLAVTSRPINVMGSLAVSDKETRRQGDKERNHEIVSAARGAMPLSPCLPVSLSPCLDLDRRSFVGVLGVEFVQPRDQV